MTLQKLTLAVAAAFALSTGVDAAMINTLISNFDVAFDGASGEITDFNRPDGGTLDAGDARTFSSLEIEVDGVSEVLLMNPPDALWGDLKITDLGSELTTGALVQDVGGTGTEAFGFDYFDPSGNLLRLEIDDISYTLIQTGIPGLNFFNFFGEAKVVDQSLPEGIAYAEDVLFSYTATDVMIMSGQNGARTVVASGQMTITGEQVPEPAGLAMVALGGLAACFGRRR